MRLHGKTALVTGAGSGFGRGIAERFAVEGARVAVADLNGEAAREVADGINEGSADAAVAVEANVADWEDTDRMVDAALDLGGAGRLDVLVLNAGTTHVNKPLLDVTEDEFDRIAAVNMKAIYLATLRTVPIMAERGGGSIIVTASTAGLRPRPGLTWYNASKAWAIGAAKSMAVELADRNIRVNALCPVAGETGMLAQFMGEDTPELRAKFRATIPLGRLSTPADMASAALWLASDEAAFITGTALEVDGGRCI